MSLKLLADVHISPITVSELKMAGYQISRITDFIPSNSTDKEIVDLALHEEAAIITQDLDFSAIVAKSGLNKPSIISLRVGNASPERISQILKTILAQIETDIAKGAIISVEDTEYRVRKLPVSQ